MYNYPQTIKGLLTSKVSCREPLASHGHMTTDTAAAKLLTLYFLRNAGQFGTMEGIGQGLAKGSIPTSPGQAYKSSALIKLPLPPMQRDLWAFHCASGVSAGG